MWQMQHSIRNKYVSTESHLKQMKITELLLWQKTLADYEQLCYNSNSSNIRKVFI